jgi:hypothetical protein
MESHIDLAALEVVGVVVSAGGRRDAGLAIVHLVCACVERRLGSQLVQLHWQRHVMEDRLGQLTHVGARGRRRRHVNLLLDWQQNLKSEFNVKVSWTFKSKNRTWTTGGSSGVLCLWTDGCEVSGEEDSGLSWSVGETGGGAGVTTRLLRFSTTAPSPSSLVTSGVGMRGRFFSDDGIADPFSFVVPVSKKIGVSF